MPRGVEDGDVDRTEGRFDIADEASDLVVVADVRVEGICVEVARAELIAELLRAGSVGEVVDSDFVSSFCERDSDGSTKAPRGTGD